MKMGVEEYIRYYNHERLHTSLGDLTMINYENLQIQVSGYADQNRSQRVVAINRSFS
ncbi:hypothetical protein CXF74_20125 [Psychromonas sp. Urea-02u-13]|nr:hypothetical protein CXF74_20125 [Psychromonas sp. Urea-02u-13]